jgi:glycosyltransferase involved in cell wall biosynthesis
MGIRSRCVLATFGFLRSYKGLEDVLDAVSLVARDIEDVTWLVFSSLHDDTAEGLRVYWELRRRAASLGLLRHLRIYTEFLPLPELGRLLQAADIIVLYYRPVPHITASSGAGRAALATGRPVVVADMSYFADLGEEVVKVEPEDPRLLGSTLLNLWSDPARRAALARRAEAKSADTAWPVVAHAHRALYERVIADSVVPELLASAALRQ